MKSGFLASAFIAIACSAFASDLQVTTTRKVANTEQDLQRLQRRKNGVRLQGAKGKKLEDVFYVVNVTNKSFNALPALEARYILFVERQELEEKLDTETIERIKGTAQLEEIPTKRTVSFDTKQIKLREGTLSGGLYFGINGRLKATDKVLGVWIKFFDGDNEVGEYVNPTTIKQRYQWAE